MEIVNTATTAIKTTTTKVEAGRTAIELNIKTNLKGRHEAFRMMALAESLRLPLLFQGVAGVGKTNVVMDYAKARHSKDKVFVLEVDEYTKPAEIKGRPNIKKLAEENVYEVLCPIVGKKFILINEIDKATGGFRTGLYSAMNEKKLFNGVDEVDLEYDCFIGTCNEIPKEERNGHPLWDRFVLKCTINRMTHDDLTDYFRSGHKNFIDTISVSIPGDDCFTKSKTINDAKMRKLVEVCYNPCSDRTLTNLPNMVKAVAHIWNCTMDNALVKTAEILAGATQSKILSDSIMTKEMKNLYDRIDMLLGKSNIEEVKRAVHDINVIVTNYAKEKKINGDQIREVEELLNNNLEAKGISANEIKVALYRQP